MNIYDIAKKAGVSIATVSRVINNSPNVSLKTREKISKLIEEENYLPSAHARGLSGTPAKTIGILTIDIRDQYFASVIYSLEQELSLHDYNVILCNTGGESNIQRNYIALLMQKKIDALILVGSVFNNPHLLDSIKQVSQEIPLIIVNENVQGDNIYSIMCDESSGISSAITHLYNNGHRDFVFVKVGDTYSSKRKVQGFYNLKNLLEIENIESRVFNIEQGLNQAREITQTIVDIKPRPTAIICSEDLTALGIIQELNNLGINVPKDISVTGFNNSIYAECSIPTLTTVDSQSNSMGLAAARLALDVLNKVKVPKLSTISTELIIRESTSNR
ncbi:MAG: LacI family DNA-binding transcriptional regulator [Spirochaetales bacterium]|nr:LacI family DNA-binding transcriptional regulator [Spirochaetales bacterium]